MFYNTTNETGENLKSARKQSMNQDELIMSVFELSGKPLTPFDVQTRLGTRVPLTSVRRAITNLTDEGRLMRTDTKKMGNYGRMTYTWVLS